MLSPDGAALAVEIVGIGVLMDAVADVDVDVDDMMQVGMAMGSEVAIGFGTMSDAVIVIGTVVCVFVDDCCTFCQLTGSEKYLFSVLVILP